MNKRSATLHVYYGAVLITLLLVLSASGCILGEGEEGRLVLNLSRSTRSISWDPDPAILSYRIDVQGTEAQSTYIFNNSSPTCIIENLATGIYTITVTAYDDEGARGNPIAHLQKNSEGNRSITVEIEFAQTTTAETIIVPNMEGSGELSFSVILEGVNSDLLQFHPDVRISFEQVDTKLLDLDPEKIEVSAVRGSTVLQPHTDYSLLLSEDRQQLILEVFGSELIEPENLLVELNSLPAGWYAISISVEAKKKNTEESTGSCMWKGIYFATVMQNIPNTTGQVLVLDEHLETGSILLGIDESMDPLPLTLMTHTQEDSEMTTEVFNLEPSSELEIFCSASAGYEQYFWYVNGDSTEIIGEGPNVSTILNESGQYTITVGALEKGNFGSTSAEILIVLIDE